MCRGMKEILNSNVGGKELNERGGEVDLSVYVAVLLSHASTRAQSILAILQLNWLSSISKGE